MAEQTVKGSLDLLIDEEELNAVLSYTAEEDGAQWDAEAILRLLAERGVPAQVCGRDEVDAALTALAKAKVYPFEFTVARGTPPEEPQPESFRWKNQTVPEELTADVNRFLKKCGPPEIFRVAVEKEKVEKVVKKKAPLPFLKEKTETVSEVQKRERREAIPVDPALKAFGVVEADAVLAEILPGTPGKPGKSVKGSPLFPDSDEQEFHLGNGITREKSLLKSEVGGLFRRGRNWAEVLPLEYHRWSLSESQDRNTCYLNFNAGNPSFVLPRAADILKEAESLGFDRAHLLSESEIAGLMNESLSSGTPLEQQSLSTDQDASFAIHVSDDRMTGTLSIQKARGGGVPLVLKKVGSAIKNSQFAGMDLKKIQEDILSFYKSKETALEAYVLAQGSPPEQPEREELQFHLDFLPAEKTAAVKKRFPKVPEAAGLESLEVFPAESIEETALVRKDMVVGEIPLKEGKPGKDVYGKEIPIQDPVFDDLKLLDNLKMEKQEIASQIEGILDKAEIEGVTFLRVRPHRDGEIHVSLAPDRMSASLTLAPHEGTGEPVSVAAVSRVLEEQGVRKGINSTLLADSVESCLGGKRVESAVVAQGKPARDAGAGKLAFEIELASGKNVAIGKDGKADYRKQDKITNVKEGALIARVMLSEAKPVDGWDVTGQELKAKESPPLQLDLGKNIRQEKDEEGNLLLYAGKGGELLYAKNRMDILDVHTVDGDVDMASGNIKFSGDVAVKGNITGGFFVVAGGSVRVGQGVDAALVSADGNIQIDGGVKGGGKAVIRAKQNLAMAFAEKSTVLAVGDVIVKNSLFNCRIKCNGRLALQSDKGHLVSGQVRARKGMEVQTIGSERGGKTEISFGQDYLIMDKIEIEEKEIEKIKKHLSKLDFMLKKLEKEGPKAKLERARSEKLKLMKVMEKRGMRLFTLRERFEEHYPSELRIRGAVYPGTVIESHGRFLEFQKKEEGLLITFNLESGRIEKKQLTD